MKYSMKLIDDEEEDWCKDYGDWNSAEEFLLAQAIDYQYELDYDGYLVRSDDTGEIFTYSIKVIKYPNKYKVTRIN